jgi:hypothetical protein
VKPKQTASIVSFWFGLLLINGWLFSSLALAQFPASDNLFREPAVQQRLSVHNLFAAGVQLNTSIPVAHASAVLSDEQQLTPTATNPPSNSTNMGMIGPVIGLLCICVLNIAAIGLAFGLSRRIQQVGQPKPDQSSEEP